MNCALFIYYSFNCSEHFSPTTHTHACFTNKPTNLYCSAKDVPCQIAWSVPIISNKNAPVVSSTTGAFLWIPKIYLATTLICLGLISSALGTKRINTPLLYSAVIPSASTGALIVSRRSNGP